MDESGLDGIEASRRRFLKKMAVGAFAVPVVTSFTMSNMNMASASPVGSNISVIVP